MARRGSRLPVALFRPYVSDDIDRVLDWAFPHPERPDLCARSGVLCTLNAAVDDVNRVMLNRHVTTARLHAWPSRTFVASTRLMNSRGADSLDHATPEFLATLTDPGVPPHFMDLAVGVVCMLTRNLSNFWTNGRRVVPVCFEAHAIIIVDAAAWQQDKPVMAYTDKERLRVPRVIFTWRLPRWSLTVERRQFPIRLAYGITFNKAQGKTLDRAVVDLRNHAFAHGQLYVALSRVRRRNDIRVLVDKRFLCNQDAVERSYSTTVNVVERRQLRLALAPADRRQFDGDYPEPPSAHDNM